MAAWMLLPMGVAVSATERSRPMADTAFQYCVAMLTEDCKKFCGSSMINRNIVGIVGDALSSFERNRNV